MKNEDNDAAPEEYHKHTQKVNKWIKKFFFIFLTIVIILPILALFTYPFISGTTENFKVGEVFEIKKGMGVSEIANFLEEEEYIKSAMVFKIYDRWNSFVTGDKSGIKAGKYVFKHQLDVFGVYNRLKTGESGIENIKFTVIEGEANFSIAKRLGEKFKGISEERFLRLAKDYEGFLYPDTYLFSPHVTEEVIIRTMKDNFDNRVGKIINKVEKSNKSLDKIVNMAAMIENEAGNASRATKRKVSGVLWNRIEIDMLLQVDAVFAYIFQRHLPRTLYSHLEVDSPYNVYRYTGFPPTPIGNPSFSSIDAAMNPTETDYLFYLTGRDGIFYYAKTYAKHKENKLKYITNFVRPVVVEVVEENIDKEV